MHSVQVLRGTQIIKTETSQGSIPTATTESLLTAQQLKETKKAKADAWKRLIPIAYEISELRQSGEKPFEMEEVNGLMDIHMYSYLPPT